MAEEFEQYGVDGYADAEGWYSLQTTGCMPRIPYFTGSFQVDGVPTSGFVPPASGTKSGTITLEGQCLDHVTQIGFTGISGLTATPTGPPAPVSGTNFPGLESLTANYSLSAGAAAGQGYMTLTAADGGQGVYSQVVVAPSLPYITSIVPAVWVSGTVQPFVIYGAGFGTNPSVGISLDHPPAGQPLFQICQPVACSDSIIEGTVTLTPEAVLDWATVTVAAGAGSAFQAAPPAVNRLPVTTPPPSGPPPVMVTITQGTSVKSGNDSQHPWVVSVGTQFSSAELLPTSLAG